MELGDGVGGEPSPDAATYTYAGTGYANPDAVTQIANGLSTTTYSYDNDGNLVSSGNGTATTTYTYDYENRLIALFAGGATTTYGYDAFGARVIQPGTSTTTLYPFKWYSIASSTGSGAKYSTTTSYMLNGDTLLATVDQQTASGVATGTAKTRYVHPDHLGSTNVVTDENDNVVQTVDYYPYGATHVSVATSTNEKRKWIDRFSDDSGLSYLNTRYYNPTQGQFLSQDPAFWGKQNTGDPQRLNAYAYGRDNPIALLDTSGWDSAYFAARPVLFFGNHIYEAYSIDSQSTSNQLNIGLTVPNNVSSTNPFNFTIGFEPSGGRSLGTGTGSSLAMSVESGNGNSGPWNGDYRDASARGFNSTLGQLTLGNYKNYAALANASVNIGGAISNAGNPYFGLGDNVMRLIATRNYYNSNGAI